MNPDGTEPVITAPTIGEPPVGPDESLANPFLSNIPEQDRQIVGKYVKDWDKQVTQKFQDYSSKLKAYEEFGDPDNIRTAITIMQELSSNPVDFVKRTQEYIEENPHLFEEFMEVLEEEVNNQQAEGQPPVDPNEYTLQELEKVRSEFESFREEQETQEQLKMLDAAIEQLHTVHGDFNDDYIIMRIAAGVSPEDAVAEWNSLIEEQVNSRKGPSAPRLLPGQGGTPLDQVDKSKLSDPKFRKEYGAELLRASLGR